MKVEHALRQAHGDTQLADHALSIFHENEQKSSARIDRMFALLMILQWVAAIVIAWRISPRQWEGRVSQIHPHVWAAIFLGGALSLLPILMAVFRPARLMTRYVIAVAQMLWSGLLIHLTGGRIETHFHIFGSLAMLAFYRDWTVLIPATTVVAADHLLRGLLWPESVYGVLTASPWRTVEHAVWVVFEDTFLAISCIRQRAEMRTMAVRQAELHAAHAGLEKRVAERTEELRLANKDLRSAKEAADGASRAKSAFLANMSHEIRTPMTAIIGYSDLMLEPDQTPSERLNCLQVIRRNGKHLLELINDVLDVSKIEAGRMSIEAIDVHLVGLIDEVASLLRPRAIEKGLEFHLHNNGEFPAHIQTDPLRLRQILVNLLGNAVKFTERGRVGLRVVYSRANPSNIRLEVFDSGIGIAAGQIEKLFQSFSQADESMTRKFGGTGLGLSISRYLARLMDGNISVTSTPGKGSTFVLELPAVAVVGTEMVSDISAAIPVPVEADAASSARLRLSGRVLLVEDGVDNQLLISTHLTRAGADVEIAENGKVAVERLGSEHFDVVLMDMQMPVMDGYLATSKLRASGFDRPIIALTANAMSEDRDRCVRAGCADYLTKPIDRDQLISVVAHYLHQAQASTAA